MIAGELRIGNLMLLKGKEVEISCYHFGTYLDTNPEMYIPIPLTEDRLMRFGMEVYTDGVTCKGWSVGINPLTRDFLFTLTWMKNMNGELEELFYRNGHHVITYVHQLQNLYFALTNTELNQIKLNDTNTDTKSTSDSDKQDMGH
jgi:hypothetical protein